MKKKIAVLTCGWAFYFNKDFISGMQRATKDQNTDLYIFDAYNFTEFSGLPNTTGFSVYNLINYQEYDGVILLSDLIGNQRILEKEKMKIAAAGKPAVSINRKIDGFSCISLDNYSGFYEVMNHLVKVHNYTDFAYLGGKENSIDFAERYKAYRTVLTENQLKVDLEKVYQVESAIFQNGYDFIVDALAAQKPFPQVLVCANDLLAYGVLKACEDQGIKVPEQLKIVGYDDIEFSKYLNPSLTTVRSSVEQAGFEAVNIILSGKKAEEPVKLNSTPIFRHSCGCSEDENQEIKASNLNFIDDLNKTLEFNSQMERIQEIFTKAEDIYTLLMNLEKLFERHHGFEGENFCLFLKADWNSVLINSSEHLPQNLDYGPNVQSVVSVYNDKKSIREVINTKSIVPLKYISLEQSSTFLIIPIFHHLYVHGYYVSKNNLGMLSNNFGYTWTRTIGDSIEHFRRRNMYKIMGQQYFKLSTRDALSGMLNRIGLDKIAVPFYEQNKKDGIASVLFFVDINSMKTINDKFGHLHGDLAVKTISSAVLETVPKNWLCIRYGGDEFLVVGNAKNYKGEDYCSMIAERISQKTNVMQLPYNLSASIGTISVPPASPWTLVQAVEEVDKIMYAKKQAYHQQMGDRH